MLTPLERVAFLLVVLVSLGLATRGALRLIRIIGRGRGRPIWSLAWRRLPDVLFLKTASLEPTFRARTLVSLLHGFVAWGFMYYLLVNLGDVLQGYISGFIFLGTGLIGGLYRLGADLLSVAALIGMASLFIRRFLLRPSSFEVRAGTTLYPGARIGIRRDSLIVTLLILFHVGFRFLGESFRVALEGDADAWQPFATLLAGAWSGWSPAALDIGSHVGWWVALGLIFAFLPYAPYSKHIHLGMAPINYLLKPERRSMGELDALDFEDESLEQFGVTRIEDLSYAGLLDAYACIMCFRCTDACPAHETGKVLSPAALEINKRYFLNKEGGQLAAGEQSSLTLTEFVISKEAVWACTACGACVQVCPVGNEPMRDILEIRRSLVLMENDFPEELQTAFRGMERTVNPWNVPPEERLVWAEGLQVPTVEQNPTAELLWWVGCAPATDTRAQETARAFARVLNAAEVDFAVLGGREQCTGDSARRAGNEYLFYELASANVELLNEVAPKRIVTTCPHCLHTLLNEYPAFGGQYTVIHHTQLLQELIADGRLEFEDAESPLLTFHDPCYLGRQNGVFAAPRDSLKLIDMDVREMPRSGAQSFCCGAGGAQMWKEEEAGQARVSEERLHEAQESGAQTLAVGCPFCMIMLSSAQQADDPLVVRDVAEIVADRMKSGDGAFDPSSP